jgi:hypothetical protein
VEYGTGIARASSRASDSGTELKVEGVEDLNESLPPLAANAHVAHPGERSSIHEACYPARDNEPLAERLLYARSRLRVGQIGPAARNAMSSSRICH